MVVQHALHAQEAKQPEPDAKADGEVKTEQPKSLARTYIRDLHRIRLGVSRGVGQMLPPLLSEAGPAWLTNSALHAARDSANNQVAVPAATPSRVPYDSWSLLLDYAYDDRWFVALSQYQVDQEFSRGAPIVVSFVEPSTTNMFAAAFEGVRLLGHKERRRNLDVSYLYPSFARGLKIGAALGREHYKEEQVLTYGSYAQTRATAPVSPLNTFWSQGGEVHSGWESSYWTWGLVLRYQLFDWLGFYYRVDPRLKRGGNLTLSGAQLLSNGPIDGAVTGGNILAPLHAAQIRETGRRHNVEAVVRFCCRYNLALGLLREDWERTYNYYAGTTLATGGIYNAKTPDGVGFGEMSGKFKGFKQEVYLKLTVAVFFGKHDISKDKPVDRTPKDFGLKKGALAELGESKYLDKMFTGVKSDFEASGVELKEIASGFEALGLKLERVPGADGKTKELRVTMDGTIGFELGSAKLTKIAKELIGKVGKAMNAYPETKARLGGHVDCCANRAYNLQLSQARSDAAKNALIKDFNVAEPRILESRGYADDRMLIPVRRLEPRNRRVEIIIITD